MDFPSTPCSTIPVGKDAILQILQNILEIKNHLTDRAQPHAQPMLVERLRVLRYLLRTMEMQGCLLLAEEITHLVSAQAQEVPSSTVWDVLQRALVALSGYVKRIPWDDRNVPMPLPPIFKELRRARGEKPFPEDMLFFVGLSALPLGVHDAIKTTPHSSHSPLSTTVSLSWPCTLGDQRALQHLANTLAEIRGVVTHPDSIRLCWVGAGLVEALQDGGLSTPSTKPLINRLKHQLQQRGTVGEENSVSSATLELTLRILYYLKDARSDGPLIRALREAFHLQERVADPTPKQQSALRPLRKKDAYLPYLDGLRALAILAVLIYHGDNAWLPGGYLGVELFFVISGFIITKLLFEEWREAGRIDPFGFYKRRLMRLFPAMFTMIMVAWLVVLAWYPEDSGKLEDDFPYNMTFFLNIYYIVSHFSYFETMGRPDLFEHLWSLGVEFQFYLVWPAVCMALFRLSPKRTITWLLVASLVGIFWMAWVYTQNQEDPSRVYFGTDTRVSAFLLGALAVFLTQHQKTLSFAIGIMLLGFVLAVLYFLEYTNPWLYYGGLGTVSLTTSLIIVYCHARYREDHRDLILSLFCNRAVIWLGKRSYGIYLWHWPVFCLTLPLVDVALEGLPLFLLRITITLACSEVSYHWIEIPFRRGAANTLWNNVFHVFEGIQQSPSRSVLALLFTVAALGIYPSKTNDNRALASAPQEGMVLMARAETPDPSHAPDSPSSLENHPPDPAPPTNQTEAPDRAAENTETTPGFCDSIAKGATSDLQDTAHRDYEHGYVTRIRADAGKKTLVFGVGDSVMVGAAVELLRQIPGLTLDAKVGRQISDATKVLNNADERELSGIVLIHIGNNGPLTIRQVEKLVASVKNSQHIVFINLKIPRNYESLNNHLLASVAQKYDKVSLIDWRSKSLAGRNVFAGDGIHVTPAGAKIYADTVISALCLPRAPRSPPDVPKNQKPPT